MMLIFAMRHSSQLLLVILLFYITINRTVAEVSFSSSFSTNSEGFIFQRNVYYNRVDRSFYVKGAHVAGTGNGGYLQVVLGGIDNNTISDMSGGWYRDFNLTHRSTVTIRLNYELYMTQYYEIDEYVQALCSVNGVLVGSNSNTNVVAQVNGTRRSIPFSWINLNNITLNAGTHRILIGGYNNRKDTLEWSRIRYSDIIVEYFPIIVPTKAPSNIPAPIQAPVITQPSFAIRINVGSTSSITDQGGNVWVPDNYFGNKGVAFTNCPLDIAGTGMDDLYCKERYFNIWQHPQPFIYDIPVPQPAQYAVRLHFAEIYHKTAGLRVFEVWVNGQLLMGSLDIFSEVGYATALVLPTVVQVTTSTLKIELVPKVDNPKLSGIEVIRVTSAPTIAVPVIAPVKVPAKAPSLPATPTPSTTLYSIRINAGSNTSYVDPNGQAWVADNYFGGKGRIFSKCPLDIATTTMDMLYCKNRYFSTQHAPQPFVYSIPVPRQGTYTIQLHFAEIYYTKAGSRLFDVWVNNKIIVGSLDIFARSGYATAFVVPTVAQVTGTSIQIQLVPLKDNPKISGIEVIEMPNIAPSPTLVPLRAPTRTPVKVPVKVPSLLPSLPTPSTSAFEFRINTGSTTSYRDPNGLIWAADNYFGNNGALFSRCPLEINGTTMDLLYCKQRYFNMWQHPQPFVYDIPVPRPAAYAVRLHFAEFYHTTAGSRVFEVVVNGKVVEKSLDIFAKSGYATAFIVSTVAQIAGTSVKIQFVPKTDNPTISGIEIIEVPNFVPSPTASPVKAPFNLLINCGGSGFIESISNRQWLADQYFIGGKTYIDGANDINGTIDDALYQSERNGEFKYEIPVPTGSYEVVLHFAELYWPKIRQRLFNIKLENSLIFTNIDIVALGGNMRHQAITLQAPVTIEDGFVSLELLNSSPQVDVPKLSGIEINFLQPHLAHSVSNGPYIATDIDNDGSATVKVDGTFSHSHGTGLEIVQWTWSEENRIIGVGATPNISLPVGEHTVTLSIKDNNGNEASDTTSITINPFGYPAAVSIEPKTGSIAGGQVVIIKGSGFTYGRDVTKVKFGIVELSGSAISIVDQFTIRLLTPPTVIGSPVSVSVQTPLATSNSITYTYQATVPIAFTSAVLTDQISNPTRAMFGPDGKLYVGTLFGQLARLTLDETFTRVVASVVSEVAPFRAILGIAFDPLQTEGLPDVYISTSFLFHGEAASSSGQAINGNVKKVSGANLDVVIDIVTGLPVADSDHAITGLEFGDNGELYIQCASNTNGGIPGPLTGKQAQKDNYYSSATVVAHLAAPNFNGEIRYSAPDDGVPISGTGIEVFASGTRNPWGICLHSNGNLYASDNGPNFSYGNFMTGCNGEFKPDFNEGDKINLLKKGGYYGAPNRIRALTDKDPRQCTWRSQYEPTDSAYTAPILNVPSSTDGLIEFFSDHFDKQLRGNLIAAKYQGSLYRIVLAPDGQRVIPQSNPAIELTADVEALDVTQAPDGTLISTSVDYDVLYFHKPIEQPATQLKIYSVFPHRGGVSGGNTLKIYGANFNNPTKITAGGKNCPVTSFLTTKLECTLPGGTGTIDIIVEGGNQQKYTFQRGYRYITGLPVV